jgi:electron transport complex protein RnfG
VLVPQFTDKNVESFTYTKTGSTSDSEIDAISGATITTKAVVNGVNAGLEYFRRCLK